VAALSMVGPLVMARRVVNWIGDMGADWYTGRYFRMSYRRLSSSYWRYYQGSGALRSLARWSIHLFTLLTLGRIMEWMVGIDHPPCLYVLTASHNLDQLHCNTPQRCSRWCLSLWLLSVIGPGHAVSVALGLWGGVLGIQPQKNGHCIHRPPLLALLGSPIRLLYDPEGWFQEFGQRRRESQGVSLPLQADALVFPTMWEPLWLLQGALVVQAMSSCRQRMTALMRQVLIQQACAEEWYKVLVQEKRLGLAAFLMFGHLCSTFWINWTILSGSTLAGMAFSVSTLA
jgi:hypothetical protein